jgi:hypothetical protein
MRVILEIRAKRKSLGGFSPGDNHGKDFTLTFVQSNHDPYIWIMEIVAPEDEVEHSISVLDNQEPIESVRVIYCEA